MLIKFKHNINLSWLLWVILQIISKIEGNNKRDIILLGGQSNMAGRGGKWDGNVPPECKPNPQILRLNAQLEWEIAKEPLHSDIDVGKTCGVGPAMAFANHIVGASDAVSVGLVPSAVGGTRITQWTRGSYLYNHQCLRQRRWWCYSSTSLVSRRE